MRLTTDMLRKLNLSGRSSSRRKGVEAGTGEKVISSTKLSAELQERLGEVEVHLTEVDQLSNQGKNSAAENVNTLSRVLKNVTNVVHGHGMVLEFLRHVIVKQDQTIKDLMEKVDGKGTNTAEFTEMAIEAAVENKIKNIKDEMKEMKERLDKVEKENVNIKKEKDKVTDEIGETRQRGLKGNILIPCPPKNGQPCKLFQQNRSSGGVVRTETQTEMCCRLIQEKTGAEIKPSDVAAYHKMSEKDQIFILNVANRAPQSGWETNQATKHYFKDDGVYLSFQLTPLRVQLLHQVRLARKCQKSCHLWS